MNSESNFPQYQCLDGQLRVSACSPDYSIEDYNLSISARVAHGHGVASSPSEHYPAGTVELQYPHFLALGLDIGSYFPGTLNLSICPQKFIINTPTYRFMDVNWYEPRGRTENFFFCDVLVEAPDGLFSGLVYYPDPSTKVVHHDDPSHLQILAPFIPNLSDEQILRLHLKSEQITIL